MAGSKIWQIIVNQIDTIYFQKALAPNEESMGIAPRSDNTKEQLIRHIIE